MGIVLHNSEKRSDKKHTQRKEPIQFCFVLKKKAINHFFNKCISKDQTRYFVDIQDEYVELVLKKLISL